MFSLNIAVTTQTRNKLQIQIQLAESFRTIGYMTIIRWDAQAPHPISASGWIGGMRRSPLDSPLSKTMGGRAREF